MSRKILFVLWQGSGTNLKSWNEYTKSKFLNRLKKLGAVYMYQDKINNIWTYDFTDSEHVDFDDDLDFDLSYIRVDKHIKMVYDNIPLKYKNYDIIPVGWSSGCLFALYFAQKYTSRCIHVILLDPPLFSPKYMKLRLKEIDSSGDNDKPTSNAQFKRLLFNWKTANDKERNKKDMYQINNIAHHIRSTYFSKHLKLQFPVPTLTFVNMQKYKKGEVSDFHNNKSIRDEIKILKKYNKINYKVIIFKNQSHYIFNNVKPARRNY